MRGHQRKGYDVSVVDDLDGMDPDGRNAGLFHRERLGIFLVALRAETEPVNLQSASRSHDNTTSLRFASIRMRTPSQVKMSR